MLIITTTTTNNNNNSDSDNDNDSNINFFPLIFSKEIIDSRKVIYLREV